MTTWAQIADVLNEFPREVLETSEMNVVEICNRNNTSDSHLLIVERAVIDSRFAKPFLALVVKKRY